MERAARTRTLDVDLSDVAAEHLDSGGALVDIRNAADLVSRLVRSAMGCSVFMAPIFGEIKI